MEITSQPKQKDYSAFNKFQQAFFTDVVEFDNFTNYEIRLNAFTLLNNLVKGFPNMVDEYINLYSPSVKTIQSPAIIKALQRAKFVTGFTRPRVPQFIYYKSSTKKAKVATDKIAKIPKGLVDFEKPIIAQIMEILMYDSKTYQYLKFSEKVQFLGKQIMGEMIQKAEQKELAKKKKKA